MSRLLLFTNDYPYRTGDVVFVEKEIRALAERFDDVVIFCHARDTSAGMVDLPPRVHLGGNLFESAPEDSPRRILEPASMLLLARAAWRELTSGRLLRHPRLFLMGAKVGLTQAHRRSVREAIAHDPDTVAYGFWAMGGGLGVPWLRGVRSRVVRVHRYDLYEDQAIGGYLPFRPFLFARADRILAISADAEDYLRRNHPETTGKVALSRLGAFGPDEAPERDPDGLTTIASCSSVIEVKRVSLILDSLRVLASQDPSRKLRWVHFGDGVLMPELRIAVANLPDGLSVELRGQVPNSEIAAFYASGEVDAFVNLSTSEGVPVSIMEAIASGIPVLATAVGGTPEIVGAELRTGELVDRAVDPATVAERLDGLLHAPAGTYTPRELWEQEYDARRTGEIAAVLVRSANGGRRLSGPMTD
ncbi:glycosyltransferase [Microbacterium aerolatum]|uniref:glycosyltransferase n=1 Tax=Microbacterium aerolatum TaxID=153731 RepID=UPI00384FC941